MHGELTTACRNVGGAIALALGRGDHVTSGYAGASATHPVRKLGPHQIPNFRSDPMVCQCATNVRDTAERSTQGEVLTLECH